MTLRKQLLLTTPAGSPAVRVDYDSGYAEYRVRLVGCPDADYFTDDPSDALSTARAMMQVHYEDIIVKIETTAHKAIRNQFPAPVLDAGFFCLKPAPSLMGGTN